MYRPLLAILAVCVACNAAEPSSQTAPVQPVESHPRSSPWETNLRTYPEHSLAEELTPDESQLVGRPNWKTGKPYTTDEVRRLKHLTTKVGDNLSLTPLTEQERDAREAHFERVRSLGERIDTQEASTSDVEEYFAAKVAYYDDREAVLRLVLAEDFWDETTKDRYRRYLDVVAKERERFETQRSKFRSQTTNDAERGPK